MDADTVAAPELLSASVTLAQVQNFDMLSLDPFQELKTFWERVIIPSGLFLLAFTQDLRRVNDPDCPEAAANGQFILIRRRVYDSICGHAAVRSEICEDSALARLVKHSGGRMALLGAEGLIRTRMYDGLGSLWEGLSKNLIEMVGGRAATVLTAGLAVLIAFASIGFYIMAAWACLSSNVVSGADVAACEGALASTALFGMHIAGARHFRIPWWYGVLFPLGYMVGALIALNSVRLRLRGEVTRKEQVIHA